LREFSSAIIYMNSRYLDSREENQKKATRSAVATCKARDTRKGVLTI